MVKRIKSIIYITIVLIWVILCNIFVRLILKRPKYNKKYRIVICGIFKNEAPFLKEWIEFHEMMGVEHFYLYNNNSEDNYQEILDPYISKGLVTLVEWPYDQAQMGAYKHYYDTYRHESQWFSFLDIDEFFCPRYEESLSDWILKHDKYPVRVIYWRMFGTSGKLKHDCNRLVIDQYTVSWDHLYYVGKCLINTDYDIVKFDSTTHHLTQVYYPFLFGAFKIRVAPANQYGWFVYNPFHFSLFIGKKKPSIQINHYWSKAWDVYERKRQMTDVFFKDNPKLDMAYFYKHEKENRSTDYSIYRFLLQLKLKMNVQ